MKSMILVAIAVLALVSPVSAGHPVEVARGGKASKPQQPQVAVDETGAIHLTYGVNSSVRYCRSLDQGQTFAPPAELPSFGSLSLGMRRGPRIAVAGGKVAITAIGGLNGKGQDGDLLCCHSSDAGATWSALVVVNDVADSAREGLHAMCAGPDGLMCCVWLDLRNNKTEVMAAASLDGGATWSKNVLVYRSPEGSVCECCHPSVTCGPDGAIHVLWRNSLSGNRDMYLATSTDGGASFGPATKLGAGAWRLDACPMDGGAIASNAPGVSTVWRRDNKVYLVTPDDLAMERLLGEGEQPWLAASSRGEYVVWVTQRGGEALLRRPGRSAPTRLAAHAYDPVLATGPNSAGPIVAAWEGQADGEVRTIMCQVVEP